MKKTLIALAAVAAASAASAQVTISGTFGLGVGDSIGLNGAADGKSAVSVTDGDIAFAVSEDLGGGYKLSASSGFDFNDGNGAGKREVTTGGTTRTLGTVGETNFIKVGLSTPFGTFAYGNTKAASARLDVGASLSNDVNQMMGGDTTDFQTLKYTLPELVKGLTLSVTGEKGSGQTAINTDAAFVAAVSYTSGPLTVGYDYRDSDDRARANLSYDFGVAKVSVTTDMDGGIKDTEDEIAITMPATPALTLGLHYARDSYMKAEGYELAAVYALSKRSSVVASFADLKWNNPGVATDNAVGSNYRVKLIHSF